MDGTIIFLLISFIVICIFAIVLSDNVYDTFISWEDKTYINNVLRDDYLKRIEQHLLTKNIRYTIIKNTTDFYNNIICLYGNKCGGKIYFDMYALTNDDEYEYIKAKINELVYKIKEQEAKENY